MLSAEDVVRKVSALGLPVGQYIVVGGGTLAVRGIRETKDLDIVVLPEPFLELAKTWPLDKEYEGKWRRQRLKKGEVEMYPDLYLERKNVYLDLKELIDNAEIIRGIPFQPLTHLMMCKLDTAREKDLADVALIEQYLQSH